MGVITINSYQVYDGNSGTVSQATSPANFATNLNDTYTELAGGMDDQLVPGEFVDNTFSTTNTEVIGTLTLGPNTFIVTRVVGGSGGAYVLESEQSLLKTDYPASFDTSLIDTSTPYAFCFLTGTLIATPGGEVAVETLTIGDSITTADNRTVTVKWIGRQAITRPFIHESLDPVRIRAGALGDGLPHIDLIVSADHGMILDGLVINASALVNGRSIAFVPLADLAEGVAYYHVETENHDVILANGAPAETFIDYAGRAAFDNHAEYLDLYGAERIIPEMALPRISTARLLPDAIKARLGIFGGTAAETAPVRAVS